jgi:DNA-binding transcriptional LysR family regulator
MDFRQAEAYWAVMRCGSVMAAARLLHVSQPAISKTIKRAEDRLGIKLFERIGGRMLPTAESHALFPDVDRVIRDIEILRTQASDLGSMQTGVLRIGASSAIAAAMMPRAVAGFQAAHPRAKIIAMLLPAAELVEKLHANALDLGFALSAAGESAMTATQIGTTRLACLLPARHNLAAREVIRPADLDGYPIITFPPDSLFGRALDDIFRAQGMAWQVAIQVDLSLQAALFVQSGCGIALVDTLLQAIDLPGVVWRPFEPALSFPIYELSPSNRPLSRVAAAFRGLARSVAAATAG